MRLRLDHPEHPADLALPVRRLPDGHAIDFTPFVEVFAMMEGMTAWDRRRAHGLRLVYRYDDEAPLTVEPTSPDGLLACPRRTGEAAAELRGVVRHPGTDTRIMACDKVLAVDAAGRFEGSFEPGRLCDIWAERTDGSSQVLSDRQVVRLSGGETTEVVLTLPEARMGTLGLGRIHPDGVIFPEAGDPGGPAFHPSWLRWSTLVAIDGRPLDDMTPHEIQQRLAAPVGDVVELTIGPPPPRYREARPPPRLLGVLGDAPLTLAVEARAREAGSDIGRGSDEDRARTLERERRRSWSAEQIEEALEPFRVDP